MKQFMLVLMVLALLLAAAPVVADPVTLVVDDDGVDCPEAMYSTIQAAVDAASPGDTIAVCTGTYAGATLTKLVHLEAGGKVVINSGPQPHPFTRAGFFFPGEGAGNGSSIRGFRFEGTPQFAHADDGQLDFPIFSRGADNVTVEYNEMLNSLQAITNWNGSGWSIHHNKIEGLWVLCGGGIGILVGAFDSTEANNNLVAHNTIEADVSPDCAYFTTDGIVLYSDTRWGSPGGLVQGNRVLRNRSRVTGVFEGVPAGVGFEIADGGLLTEYPWTGDENGPPNVTGNTIAFNDFRGSSTGINLLPQEVEDNNTLSRNLGDNRGHGETPAGELFH